MQAVVDVNRGCEEKTKPGILNHHCCQFALMYE